MDWSRQELRSVFLRDESRFNLQRFQTQREVSTYLAMFKHNTLSSNGPYAPFGFESIEKQLWRNKQNDRPISDSEIKAVLSQLFKTDQWLPPAGQVSESVTSHA
ncbi:hypothetical protein AVEN_196324-1 [Araneus ventricosus]|uniref:Uncharacterized protein n=1 Tax=Araneus ventricosus TaxID=182803 RepID=A0A4Y2AUU7_ARAVE|nr:hypothetical protein AVEN_196324-1 [Araneus ventricosus]